MNGVKGMKNERAKNQPVCLPHIKAKREPNYRAVTDRGKKEKRVYWYDDYSVSLQDSNVEQIIELINSRDRFRPLREFTDKLLRTDWLKDEMTTRFVINAQTANDAFLAMVYLSHRLSESHYHKVFNYSTAYRLHTNWRDNDDPFALGGVTHNLDNEIIAKPLEQRDGEADKRSYMYRPWWWGQYPVYIDMRMGDTLSLISDDDALDAHRLIFALESRDYSPNQTPSTGLFGGFEDGDFALPDPQKTLVKAGFKTIYLPDAETDELKELFERVSAKLGMKLARGVKFDTLKIEYEEYLTTEYDIQILANIIREHKRIEGSLLTPISYKTFVSVLGAATEQRRIHAAAVKKRTAKKDNPWDELNNLIGCTEIKRDITKMVDLLKLDKHRREHGLPNTRLTMHSVFYGAPGCAKTTVAVLLSRILQHEGIIKSGAFRNCEKSSLTQKFVGWSGDAVDSMYRELHYEGGGAILIDEAYALTDSDTCFDREVINCLVSNMDRFRDIITIFAGYKPKMQQFLNANIGLRSRIGFSFEFSNYSAQETYKIAEYQAKSLGYILPNDCEQALVSYFTDLKRLQGEHYGNGRSARTVIEAAACELASRLAKQKGKPTKVDCTRLTIEDVTAAIKSSLDRERTFGAEGERRRIGFGS